MTEDQLRARISELNNLIEASEEHTPEVSAWTRERNELFDKLALLEQPIPVPEVPLHLQTSPFPAVAQASGLAFAPQPPALAFAPGLQLSGVPVEALAPGTLLIVTPQGLAYYGKA